MMRLCHVIVKVSLAMPPSSVVLSDAEDRVQRLYLKIMNPGR